MEVWPQHTATLLRFDRVDFIFPTRMLFFKQDLVSNVRFVRLGSIEELSALCSTLRKCRDCYQVLMNPMAALYDDTSCWHILEKSDASCE